MQKVSPSLKFLLNVSVVDEKAMKSELSLEVNVEDIDNHQPKFERPSYQFQIEEGT